MKKTTTQKRTRKKKAKAEVAAPALPYTSPPTHHRHKCPECECVWEHHNNAHGDEAAHTCPDCGHNSPPGTQDGGTWWKYHGPEAPKHKEDPAVSAARPEPEADPFENFMRFLLGGR
jgi:hypothetical protein